LIKCRRNGKQKLERFCGRNVEKMEAKASRILAGMSKRWETKA
jgi:hypothetical protein